MATFCPYTGGDVIYPVCAECEDKICKMSSDVFACIIAGSRTFDDYAQMKERMDFLLQDKSDVMIISGGAKGADTLAEKYASESSKCTRLIVMKADWDLYGKSAGFIRNEKMHKSAAHFNDRGCVLFWDGTSKGTKQNISLARKYSTPLKIVKF